jgi:hypothetical protein
VASGTAAAVPAANADRMVEAFAVRLNDATDLDRVRADLTSVVSQALEPAHVTVWTARGS